MLPQLARLSHARVLALGDAMLDQYWHGGTARVSAEVSLAAVMRNPERRLGSGADAAINTPSLGALIDLNGAVGADEAVRNLVELLPDAGVRANLIAVPEPQERRFARGHQCCNTPVLDGESYRR